MENVVHVTPTTGNAWAISDDSIDEQDGITFASEAEAEAAARKRLEAAGGGELVVHHADGDIASKELVGIVDTDELPG